MHVDSSRTSLSLWWHMFVQKNLFLTIFMFGLGKLLLDERMHLFQHWNLLREGEKKRTGLLLLGRKRILKNIWASQVGWGDNLWVLMKPSIVKCQTKILYPGHFRDGISIPSPSLWKSWVSHGSLESLWVCTEKLWWDISTVVSRGM